MSRLMVVTEKPLAAKKIATALDENRSPNEVRRGKVTYYSCKRHGNELIVVYALGHLYELQQIEKGWTYPRLESKWVPRYEVDKKAVSIKPIITLIRNLSRNIDEFIVATDYDIEGSLIGYLTLKYACKTNPDEAYRMTFSALTDLELARAFDSRGKLDFPAIEAGQVRHEVDWLYGINMTRALTLSIKKVAGWFKVVSTGRVQGPTLAFIAEREKNINLFVPTPFWSISLLGRHAGNQIELEYSKRHLPSEMQADKAREDLRGQNATVEEINAQTVIQNPNPPFNLSSLQLEAYRHLGFKPSRTLAIAQSLYLDSLISYPRTNSEVLPSTLDIRTILIGLGEMKDYMDLAQSILRNKLHPAQGKKTDPAHPAIHPTGEKPTKPLSSSDRKLYDLIVRRFLALFGEPLIKNRLRADITCNGHALYIKGLQIVERGWSDFYEPYFNVEEKPFPDIKVGDTLRIVSVDAQERYTQAPARFNPASLLKLLERENLGTKATRSSIVDSVKSRGYAQGERFELSTLGYAVFETLDQYVPDILSPEMTRQLEAQMDSIQEGVKNRELVITGAKSSLVRILDEFRSKEQQIGETLIKGLQRYWKDTEELGPCPSCGNGVLRIIRSQKTGKRFAGCSNYKEGKCDQTFPLPQKGTITPLDETCPHCGFRMMKVVSNRRAWTTCINWSKCLGKQDELKALSERRNKKENDIMGDDVS
jgi:DNA topoisomerase-1